MFLERNYIGKKIYIAMVDWNRFFFDINVFRKYIKQHPINIMIFSGTDVLNEILKNEQSQLL